MILEIENLNKTYSNGVQAPKGCKLDHQDRDVWATGAKWRGKVYLDAYRGHTPRRRQWHDPL